MLRSSHGQAMIRIMFLAVGLLVLGGLVWHIGPSHIAGTVERIGFVPFCIILTPLLVVYGLDTYGWRLTMGPWASRVGFVRLFMVRMAGEAVNTTTPSGMLGGEPLKAYLLTRYDVPMVEGLASVVVAKTTMVLAQILFMLLGIGLLWWVVGGGVYSILAAWVSVGMLAFFVFLLVLIQRYGIGTGLLTLAAQCRIRSQWLVAWRPRLLELDRTVQNFYRQRRRAFALSFGVHFVSWLIELFEVHAILYFLGAETGWLMSLSIAAIAVLIKGASSFVPGGLGVQEGGYLFLLMGLGYGEMMGITFAFVRRIREIIWILAGLVFLAVLRGKATLAVPSSGVMKP